MTDITAPVNGDLVDPTWAGLVTAAVNSLQTRMATAEGITTKLSPYPTLYTPTLTNITLGGGTNFGAYTWVGYWTDVLWVCTLGASGALGSSPGFTLPNTPDANYASTMALGRGALGDAGIKDYDITIRRNGAGQNADIVFPGTNGQHSAINATTPFTAGSGDYIIAHCRYLATTANV